MYQWRSKFNFLAWFERSNSISKFDTLFNIPYISAHAWMNKRVKKQINPSTENHRTKGFFNKMKRCTKLLRKNRQNHDIYQEYILFEIFKNLPVKSLLRFRSVSKRWQPMINASLLCRNASTRILCSNWWSQPSGRAL